MLTSAVVISITNRNCMRGGISQLKLYHSGYVIVDVVPPVLRHFVFPACFSACFVAVCLVFS